MYIPCRTNPTSNHSSNSTQPAFNNTLKNSTNKSPTPVPSLSRSMLFLDENANESWTKTKNSNKTSFSSKTNSKNNSLSLTLINHHPLLKKCKSRKKSKDSPLISEPKFYKSNKKSTLINKPPWKIYKQILPKEDLNRKCNPWTCKWRKSRKGPSSCSGTSLGSSTIWKWPKSISNPPQTSALKPNNSPDTSDWTLQTLVYHHHMFMLDTLTFVQLI